MQTERLFKVFRECHLQHFRKRIRRAGPFEKKNLKLCKITEVGDLVRDINMFKFNSFSTNVSLLYPLKTSENL